MINSPKSHRLTRRSFIALSAQFAAGALINLPLLSQAALPATLPLSFYHTHTGETLELIVNPRKIKDRCMQQITRFLRDFRTGTLHPIDPRLLQILCRIQSVSGSTGTFEVISGYRSPATNEKLRQQSNGVAKKSLHTQGKAIDVRLSGLKTRKLRDIACNLKFGGVGYYPRSDFVHLDTGRIRTW